MSKEVNNVICTFCETDYKLSYNTDKASGYPKFCPFCSEEINEKDEEEQDDET
jgi:uncharacterized Zn-finger protein